MDYTEVFKNLKPNNKYARKSPYKAVLLLTVIEMYETNMLLNNEIKYDITLKSTFSKVWNRTFPNKSTIFAEAYVPFWYMQNEDFWHVVPKRGKEDILNLLRDEHIKPSETKIIDCVKYVELDEDLFFLMTMSSGRSSLKRVLLETYTTLSPKAIERLSASTESVTNYSFAAMDQYKQMLKSEKDNHIVSQNSFDNENKGRFVQLDEDLKISLILSYYSFLKEHRTEREMFREICPTVYDLYNCITLKPFKMGEISPSFAFTYENFLCDLKISLMSEDGSMELIDSINHAICVLRGEKPETTIIIENKEDGKNDESREKEENVVSSPIESYDVGAIHDIVQNKNLQPLSPARESRQGKAWSSYEEELISLYYHQGYGTDEIAQAMGRTESSIKIRLSNLGIIAHINEDDVPETESPKEKASESLIDFYVENTSNRCSIFNIKGERVFTTDGKLKIFHGRPYRFNYKSMCFTVKGMLREGETWIKGSKKLVAYDQSDLYKHLDPYNFLDKIEDFLESSEMENNKIKYDGVWYDFDGDTVSGFDVPLQIDNSEDGTDNMYEKNEETEYVPKGKLKCIDEIAESSYDYLWLMSIVDFMGEKHHSTSLSFDELACMMIAISWELLNENPTLKEIEKSLTACINFLIEESKEYMDEELTWSSSKDAVYELIKDYPMAGVFEDTVEELLEKAPYSILNAWLKDEDKENIIIYSLNFKKSCLYAIHPRKVDPYIEINPKWTRSLFFEHNNLMKYLKSHYIKFLITL